MLLYSYKYQHDHPAQKGVNKVPIESEAGCLPLHLSMLHTTILTRNLHESSIFQIELKKLWMTNPQGLSGFDFQFC